MRCIPSTYLGAFSDFNESAIDVFAAVACPVGLIDYRYRSNKLASRGARTYSWPTVFAESELLSESLIVLKFVDNVVFDDDQ